MDVLFIDKADIQFAAIIAIKKLDVIYLDFSGFIQNAFVGVCQAMVKKLLPFCFAKAHFVEKFQLYAQVVN